MLINPGIPKKFVGGKNGLIPELVKNGTNWPNMKAG
jgi:hypothetical protein